MKILFNASAYKPARKAGGPIHSVAALAEGLVQRGHEVFVATSNRDLDEPMEIDTTRSHDVAGVQVRYFRARPTILHHTRLPYFSKSTAIRFGSDFAEWLGANAKDFDVMHTQISFLTSSSQFSRTARRHNKIYLYHQRGNLDPVRLKFRALKKRIYIQLFELPVIRRADLLLALTGYEVESYRALGVQNRIAVLPNGIAAGFQKSESPPSAGMREFLNRLGEQPVLLFLSRLHPTKGPEKFVEAFINVARQQNELVAVVAGPDEFGLAANLRARIQEVGLSSRCHFTGGVEGADKLALLQRANLFVLPTISEGFSMVLLEALACGCPLLTTPGAHFPEAAKCGAAEIVSNSAHAISEAMQRLLAGGMVSLREMGERGRQLVRRDYSWRTIVEHYEALCQEALERQHSTG